MGASQRPLRVLVVFAWLVVGGEETEIRLLAQHADPERLRIEVVACFRRDGMPDQSYDQLRALGVQVDTTPYTLSYEDTVDYLASIIPAYDVIISCQDVADVYPALESLAVRPPLIEHGGLVSEALSGPKHLTSRYVGVCQSIRDAAAGRMPGREDHALVIPSMIDPEPFRTGARDRIRAGLGVHPDQVVVGWVGRLDRKKNVHEVLEGFALAAARQPALTLWIVGGPDAFMPEYAQELRDRVARPDLAGRVAMLGDRHDVGDLMQGMDALVWLSRGEGMPHVVSEAGAAGLPVVVTPDNGVLEQVVDGHSGLMVAYSDPAAVAEALVRLAGDQPLRRRLGGALRHHVCATFATDVVVPQWQDLLWQVAQEARVSRELEAPRARAQLFATPFLGGFECSSHRRLRDRRRVDVIAATGHDRLAADDYRQLAELGIGAVRDGLRWHLVESAPGRYDLGSLRGQVSAARQTGTQVIWDLLHYGWPDDVDVWSPGFPARFADFASAVATHLAAELPGPRWYAPVNEMSFLSWGGGEVGYLNPFARRRGIEFKVQLVRAGIMAADQIRAIDPTARFVQPEPLIHVVPAAGHPRGAADAEAARRAQFEAWDMLSGRAWPQLGGRPDLLDVVGVNYYPDNQWEHEGPVLPTDDPRRRPLADLLGMVHARYGRPVMISETGTEGADRAAWLTMVDAEAREARRRGVPVIGICLYPVLDHPGWDDERYCPNGLLTFDPHGERRGVDPALLTALRTSQRLSLLEENPWQ